MKKHYDRLLKLLKCMVPMWNVLVFGYVWVLYYNEQTNPMYWKQRLLIVEFIYIIIYFAFGKLYNAFKIGTYKTSELLFSQLLSFGIADFCLYLESCILKQGYINILPGVLAVGVQLLGSLVLIVVIKRYFMIYIPPQHTLFIYGKKSIEDANKFIRKIERKLSHMFSVEESCSDDLVASELLEKMEKYETVLMFHVSNKIRRVVLAEGTKTGKNIYVTPRIEDILLTNFENRHIIDTPLMKSSTEDKEYTGKRALDIIFSGILILIFLPFMLTTAICIKLEDHGPVFYKQKRVTKGGKVFEILKFRSMIVDAEKEGVKPCVGGDSRITKVGKIIRATRLDETPQLINILKGDMSIVGPRPERVEHVEKYTKDLPEFAYRLRVRGGLTGYAQIYGKYNTSAEDKLKMDLMYIERQSLIQDLQLIFLTIKIVFTPESTEGFEEQQCAALQKK